MSRQFRSDDTVKWTYGFGDGSDGDLTISSNTTEAPIDSSCSGTAGTTSLTATNASFAIGQIILIHQTRGTGAGNWELAKIAGYTAGTITTDKVLQNTYTDSGASQAQVRVMKQYNNVTVNSGITYTVKSWNQDVGGILGFMAMGAVTINGSINGAGNNGSNPTGGSGKGFNGGNGANGSPSYKGEGTVGASVAGTGSNGNGGGGLTSSGGGGGGGHANAGETRAGTGGLAVGDAELTSMNLGGGGGGGRDTNNSGGGGGGAIVFIIASDFNCSSATLINLQGGSPGNNYWNGGAGAGGSFLLKCVTATVGTNKISCPLKDANVALGTVGGDGSAGRIHIDYSGSITGTTNPTLSSRLDPTIKPAGGGGAFFQFM